MKASCIMVLIYVALNSILGNHIWEVNWISAGLRDMQLDHLNRLSRSLQCLARPAHDGLTDHANSCPITSVAGFWLGFFTHPIIQDYGWFWWNWQDGHTRHRWTDQQFWFSAIRMFAGDPNNVTWFDGQWFEQVYEHK